MSMLDPRIQHVLTISYIMHKIIVLNHKCFNLYLLNDLSTILVVIFTSLLFLVSKLSKALWPEKIIQSPLAGVRFVWNLRWLATCALLFCLYSKVSVTSNCGFVHCLKFKSKLH